ncbi:hypothetical protein GCM10007301_36130 [Azorhizobium oxalatiphilum]|uniref:Dihydropteroate synthase n=1 Tax=Azorhizobium oxalatiphilum TaxID=980631 RepID=A0A917C6H2_9HYPH|nr:dihydropteroate synthase [Azorhizobium oxalatiphilum]GGF73088.1 hypothetical protein GCM10007301_36130 [Azorhizobium oxalatiphilum]
MNTTSPATRILDVRGRPLPLGARTLIMGILNVTPDSFSDGGISAAPKSARDTARRLVAEGADIIDVGGESTRPGYTMISDDEEWARLAPVLDGLGAELGVTVSVDTYKSGVARRALEAGVGIINDIWGFAHDPDMARAVADYDAAVVLMHNRDAIDPAIDIMADMIAFFERALETADKAGIPKDRIVLDPGVGFGKTFEQNLASVARLRELRVLGLPLLLGTSRKSMIGKVVATEPQERLPGTIASNVIGMMEGVEIIRVHDVAEHVQAARVTEAIRAAG